MDKMWERAQELAMEYHDTELEYRPEKVRETLLAMAEREHNELEYNELVKLWE